MPPKKIKDFETFKVQRLHHIKGGNDGDIGPGHDKEIKKIKRKNYYYSRNSYSWNRK